MAWWKNNSGTLFNRLRFAIGWRAALTARKVRGGLPGVGWRHLLFSLLPGDWQRPRPVQAFSRLISVAKDIEVFGTPWGHFSVPTPGEGVLNSLLDEIFVGREYENSKVALAEGDIVVDCGAHVGVFARFALARAAARVVCVEMEELNFSCLQQNLGCEGGRVLALQAALWSRRVRLNFIEGANPTPIGLTKRKLLPCNTRRKPWTI